MDTFPAVVSAPVVPPMLQVLPDAAENRNIWPQPSELLVTATVWEPVSPPAAVLKNEARLEGPVSVPREPPPAPVPVIPAPADQPEGVEIVPLIEFRWVSMNMTNRSPAAAPVGYAGAIVLVPTANAPAPW
jgi:hypothetical protein